MEKLLNASRLTYNPNIQNMISKIRFSILISCVLVLFNSCQNQLPEINLSKELSVDVIADSIYFLNVGCMTSHEGEIFFINGHEDNIITLNEDLSLIKIIGTRGQGPNELLGLNKFSIKDSLMAVLNGGNNRINIFNLNGRLLKEHGLNNTDIRFHSGYRFVFNGREIIGSSSLADTPLTIYNINNQRQSFFGEKYEFPLLSQATIRNDRHTLISDEGFIVVSDNMPFIEVYDIKTNMLKYKYDYSTIGQVGRSLNEIKNKGRQNQGSNSYYTLCQDVYFADNYLYILFANYTNGYRVNELVKFELTSSIKPISILKLPGKIYSSFCVSKEFIYGYNSAENTIERFKL